MIDNSALVPLQFMRPDAMPSVWNRLEALAKAKRLLICKAVFDEYKNDRLKPWFEARKDMLVYPYTTKQFECLKELTEVCPTFLDSSKPGPDADQPLVAMAMALNDEFGGCFASGPACVVAHERRTQQGAHRMKIPDACDLLEIEVIDFSDMIARDGPI